MRFKHNKKNSKLVLNRKNSEYAAQKNEEQLQREKILLGYDYIRSSVRSSL
ncbi:MAG TPA: hypothetical protein VK142_02140 [Bacillota bacterium]|nr:hypothetical protein [Bacillota bacterium]